MDVDETEEIDEVKRTIRKLRIDWHDLQKRNIDTEKKISDLEAEKLLFQEKMEVLREELESRTSSGIKKYKELAVELSQYRNLYHFLRKEVNLMNRGIVQKESLIEAVTEENSMK